MKLEVGKYYKLRNRPDVKNVRAEAVLPHITTEVDQVIISIFHTNGDCSLGFRCQDGSFYPMAESIEDIVAEYDEDLENIPEGFEIVGWQNVYLKGNRYANELYPTKEKAIEGRGRTATTRPLYARKETK